MESLNWRLLPSSQGLKEFNPCHHPGGSPVGGQFCSRAEATGPYPSQEDRAGWEAWWAREKDWKSRMTHAVSLGLVDPKDAETLGWVADSNAEKGYEPLPDTLFHVTTAYNNVLLQGLKTRAEIGGVHRGLGGGTDDTVSFTTDLATARAIHSAILEARRVARGEITVQQMVRMAKAQPILTPKTGRGAYMQSQGPVSAYEMLVGFYAGKTWKQGDPFPESLDRLLQGTTVERVADSKLPELKAMSKQLGGAVPTRLVPAGMKPVGTWQGRDESFTFQVERAMTRQEKLDAAWEMYKRYAMAREHAGGRIDPLFFLTDRPALAKVPVKDIKIMKFKPARKARGYRVSALGEWRVNTGRAVRYAGLAESA